MSCQTTPGWETFCTASRMWPCSLSLSGFSPAATAGSGGAPGLKALDCKQRRAVLLDHAPHEGLEGVCLVPGGLPSASAAPSSIFRAALIILSWDMPSHLLRTSSGAVLVSASAATWTSSAQDTQRLRTTSSDLSSSTQLRAAWGWTSRRLRARRAQPFRHRSRCPCPRRASFFGPSSC
jgi:hypothetical protein